MQDKLVQIGMALSKDWSVELSLMLMSSSPCQALSSDFIEVRIMDVSIAHQYILTDS